MIPLSPALLVAAANAFVGLGEDGGDNRGQMVEMFLREVKQPAGQPWCAAFVHHVGYWSHFDHRAGHSSWPLPATASCWQLGDFARKRKILELRPTDGDVFLVFSRKMRRYYHTGIVISVDECHVASDSAFYLCRTVEGNTNSDGSENGYTTLRRKRRFSGDDAFIKWVKLDSRLTTHGCGGRGGRRSHMSDNRCAFCRAKFRANALLPKFPLGKRLAFDPALARLWAICAKCGQWNLAPLDAADRRAAVDKLEHIFPATASRTATDNIGVAKLSDGVSLVRVGTDSWSHFAAWRYGRRIRRRYYGYIAFLVFNTLFANVADSTVWATTLTTTLTFIAGSIVLYWALVRRPICGVRLDDGGRATMFARHAHSPRIVVRDDTWELFVRHDRGESVLTGPEALRVLAVLLAQRYANGASKEDIAMAIDMIDRAGGPERVFTTWLRPGLLGMKDGSNRLGKLPKPLALALEMAAHEETERRALQGELAALKLEMRDAAEQARIVEEFA